MLHFCTYVSETVDDLVEFSQPCGSFIDSSCPPLQRRPGERLPFLHKNFPSKAELLACLPPELLSFKPAKAWGSLFMSLSLSLVAYGLGTKIPLLPPDTHRRPTLVALRAGHGHCGGRLLGDRP